jgi:hypothetical protein
MNENYKYESGQGKGSSIPPEIKGWNWGAFFLNWIWGIGNSTYIALLMFIPFVNLVMIFVLGAKGNQWAWQNRVWKDVEHFKSTQKKWAIVGLSLIFIVLPIFLFSIMSFLKGEAYIKSLQVISSNQEVIKLVGEPIKPGFFVAGNIRSNGVEGNAILQYSISGVKQEAQVYVKAYKKLDKWILKEVIVYDLNQHKIDVVKKLNEKE